MELVGVDELLAWAEDVGAPRLSLLCPTHRAGPQAAADRIRWKNLLQAAARTLAADGVAAAESDALLAPARALVDDSQFWDDNGDGLAVFSGFGWSRFVRVPVHLPLLVALGPRCFVGPLLPVLTEAGRFYVLAVSQDAVRLYEVTRSAIDEVTVDGLPPSPLATAPQERRQTHAFVTDRGGATGRAVFQGVGSGVETDRKKLLETYFHQVDAALRGRLAGDTAPVVLAAVGYLQPLYQKTNTLPTLLAEGITGSVRDIPPDQLQQRGWAIVEPMLRSAERRAAERFRELAGTGRTLDEPEAAARAARDGQVDTLFVDIDAADWQSTGDEPTIVLLEQRTVTELLDLAAVDTLRQSGEVYAVPAPRMPAPTPVAAVLRY